MYVGIYIHRFNFHICIALKNPQNRKLSASYWSLDVKMSPTGLIQLIHKHLLLERIGKRQYNTAIQWLD